MNRQLLLIVLLIAGLSACDSNDNDRPRTSSSAMSSSSMSSVSSTSSSSSMAAMSSYELTIYNATANQPLSPIAVLAHTESYIAWSVGTPASSGLEWLAESGMATNWVSEASDALGEDLLWSSVGEGVVMPGAMASFTLMVDSSEMPYLSLATMLVNTNDAFTGAQNWMISDLAEGESKSMYLAIYDSGTEANSESAASIPGPAAGGEGYNSARDDVDFVAMHPGVVSMHDGLNTSALNESHRFQSNSIMVRVTKMQ